jgi:hypothetical protein
MSAHAYQRILDALERHGSHGNGRQHQCPAHEDRVASLTITDADDRVLIHCHAGCDPLAVLDALGLDWSALFDDRATGKGWSTPTLRRVGAEANGDGRVVLGSVRYMPGARDGQVKSLAVRGSSRDLWPDPAAVEGDVLYVVEGEPDAVTAAQLGLPAVGVPGSGKWQPRWAPRLADGRRRVVVVTDSDDAGRKAARKWAAAIVEHCDDVRVLDLAPERSDGYDLGDFAKDAETDEDRAAARAIIARAAEASKPFVTAPAEEGSPGSLRSPSASRLERRVTQVTQVTFTPTPDTRELLDEIEAFLERFVVLPSSEARDLLALWVIHTWALDAAFATPYLRVTSAAPGSGKTLLLEVLAAVTRNGWHAVNPSVAVLYRKIDRTAPTLLLDEMDNYPLDDRRDALAVLNAGYKHGATVDRCKENGDLESFSAYCPKAYAGLDNRQLVDTLVSRSITIRLDAKLASERVEMWIAPIAEPEAAALRARCEQWAAGQDMDALARERPKLPDCLVNRAAEVWWALLVLAEHAGGDWPARAARAAEALTTGGDVVDDKPDQVQLLEDIRRAFADEPTITTAELLEKLNALDESPWGGRRRGEGLDARGLARMLRPFKIRSRSVHTPERKAKGYRLDQFEEVFARHLGAATTTGLIEGSGGAIGAVAS